ncbi:MAG: endonuclease domain-containing protein [Patescibacteria group bacterium]
MGKYLYNKQDQTQFRRKLRNDMPEPERRLWNCIRGKQVNGKKFRRQFGVGKYVLDFYCTKARLAIEIDGDSHYDPVGQAHDAKRDKFLRQRGIKVIRFTNNDIMTNIEGVIDTIRLDPSLTSP